MVKKPLKSLTFNGSQAGAIPFPTYCTVAGSGFVGTFPALFRINSGGAFSVPSLQAMQSKLYNDLGVPYAGVGYFGNFLFVWIAHLALQPNPFLKFEYFDPLVVDWVDFPLAFGACDFEEVETTSALILGDTALLMSYYMQTSYATNEWKMGEFYGNITDAEVDAAAKLMLGTQASGSISINVGVSTLLVLNKYLAPTFAPYATQVSTYDFVSFQSDNFV